MPIPKKLEKAINKFARRDAKIAKKLYPYITEKGDLRLFVLKFNGRNGIKYDVLGIIDAWGADFDEYRDRTKFSISTTSNDFGPNQDETFFEIIKRASHIAKENGEIYSIKDGDTVQAFYFDFSYKVFGKLEAQKTFQYPEDTVTQP